MQVYLGKVVISQPPWIGRKVLVYLDWNILFMTEFERKSLRQKNTIIKYVVTNKITFKMSKN